MRAADFVLSVPSTNHDSISRTWLAIGAALFVVALTALALRIFVFEALIALIAEQWSSDGEISAQNRGKIGSLVVELALWSSVLGLLALTMSRSEGRARLRAWLLYDPLATSSGSVPNPAAVLVLSAVFGVAIIVLWLVHTRTPIQLDWLYAKEGTLEVLTFMSMMGGALWSGAAARYSYGRTALQRCIALTYAGLAMALFLAAMEEISWGQTYFAWQTPQSWAAINHQQETSLHNLLDYDTLNTVTRMLALGFAIAALLAVFVGLRLRHPYVSAVAPHVSTAPVLFFMGYTTVKFHLEIPELLFGVFAALYGWRIYRASKAGWLGRRESPAGTSDPSTAT